MQGRKLRALFVGKCRLGILLGWVLGVVSCSVNQEVDRSEASLNPTVNPTPYSLFSIESVTLLDGPFKYAQDKNVEYLLALDPDKLLAPFLREAGLPMRASSYGNWESIGLDGHIGGHYLSALAMAYAATGNAELKVRLTKMVDTLVKVQEANGDGYIGGVPGSKEFWDDVANQNVNVDAFSLGSKWVPWYNLHKTFAGLRDAYRYTDNIKAKQAFLKLCDWAINVTAKMDDLTLQAMLDTEHGGMNEVLADAYAISGDAKYLKLARRFTHRDILDPLLKGEDQLTGLHANTQIPKIVGVARISELANDEDWAAAADYFWHTVTQGRTISIGGNSVSEHFHATDNFLPMVESVEGPETCNTYNMLKLSQHLYARSGQLEYVQYYEKALYNHILSSQHPETGGLVYFTPVRPQHYRKYSTVDNSMWCCVGTGIENHSKYGEFIYAHRGDQLFVNLWVPSRLNWRSKGVIISQRTQFPEENTTQLTVERAGAFQLNLRIPAWQPEGTFKVAVNGEALHVTARPGEYFPVSRSWQAGDVVTVQVDPMIAAEPLPDGLNYYSVTYGPIVLAARSNPFPQETVNYFANDSRMAHVAEGAKCPIWQSPRVVAEKPDFYRFITRRPGSPLTFDMPASDGEGRAITLTLEPFYRVHESRYTIYFPFYTPAGIERAKQKLRQKEIEQMKLEALTIDKVNTGEQQPEAEHNLLFDRSESGVYRDRHWRHAQGWFSYDLSAGAGQASMLRVTYSGGDRGRRFKILVNGVELADVHLQGAGNQTFYDVEYDLKALLKEHPASTLTVKFQAARDSIAGGVYFIRVLSDAPVTKGL